MELQKEYLALAGEYTVASELCRRGIYAQLTLANRKRTDLLVQIGTGRMLNIQVKTKQKKYWVLVKGIIGEDIVIVFVDYQNKQLGEMPDYYILNSKDWRRYVKYGWLKERVQKGFWRIDESNCPIRIGKDGVEKWKGVDIEPDELVEYKDKWDKIVQCSQ
ncbi:MAG: hypothetical protein PHY28_06945 [Dehalococcoidales bacterium]|nr:hypothetical protein [Dehalococcoidales bacterium]